MADLDMPQRQTFPAIRGRIEDAVGALDLSLADELELLLEVDVDSDLFALPATDLDPEDPGSVFMDADGNEIGANFEAPIGNSGLSTDVATFRGKLKITWDSAATPPAVQFAPKTGFISVVITQNVQVEI